MRKNWKSVAAVCMSCGMLAMQVTGCGQNQMAAQERAAEEGAAQGQTAAEQESTEAEGGQIVDTAEAGTVTVALGEGNEKSITYDAEDLDTDWEEADATGIVLSQSGVTVTGEGARADGNTVVIENGGTYVVSGSMADGQIRVEAGEQELVHLVLNGAELSNETTSPIYSSTKCKVVLTLEAGTKNVVADGTEYQLEAGEDEPDAAIFTKGDLTINGTGELEVTGNYACGIRSKDDLMVISGVIRVNAESDGLKGKDSVVIRDGQIDLVTGKDGIKSNNDEDADKGYIWIDGGVISIAAQDDGIQAETALVVNGGEITIRECQEGLAGKTVDILGGVIDVVAQDDGMNAAGPAETEQEKMRDQDGVYLRIAGGEIRLDAKADGIDSNGDFYMEGGTLYISGPEGSGDGILDYNGTAVLSGGTMIAAGSSGMMQTFGGDSTQNYLVVYYEEQQEAGTKVSLLDADGEELAGYTPGKAFRAVILTAPGLEEGSTCSVVTGETAQEVTINGVETTVGTVPAGGRGMRGGGRGGEKPENMERPEGGRGERPEGMEWSEGGRGERPEGMERPAGGRGSRPDGGQPSEGAQ